MEELVNKIATGRWFMGDTAPFKCNVAWHNPKLCIITGPNASGKSVLRKIVNNHVHEQGILYVSMSQEDRCNSSGMKRLFVYGSETDDSTGYNSVKMLTTCLKSIKKYNDCIVMIDEPEIGCSEEVQAAMGKRIAFEIANIDAIPNVKCIFLITHSRQIIKNLMSENPSHWRLSDDGMTLDQFVDREIIPENLDDLLEESVKVWRMVQKMIEK